MQNNLTLLEDIWSQYMGTPVGWPEPYCGSSPKYRAQVFISEAWWCNGGGFDGNIMALYVNPLAILDIAGTGHEFNHTLQFISNGLQGSNYAGWFWEDHSQWMRHQLKELHENMDCSYIVVGEPHLYFGSTRDNFCSWDFFEYEKDKYGYTAITNIWFNAPKPSAANASTADPIWIYASNMGWNQSQLNDEFGRWAMANVNWDEYVDPNGNNQAPLMRSYYGANTQNTGVNDAFWPNWTRTRLTQLNAVNNPNAPRTYQVPSYWAPQRFGYNLVRLIPDPGATSATVNFTGFVQSSAANTNFGNYTNVPAAVPPPDSDWRWGLVAIDVNGNERKSALQSGASASLTFSVAPSDQGIYMVVVGTPDNQQSILDDQLYFTIYRYPWMVQLENAQPDGYQAGFQLPYVASGQISGTTWPNGGGFVANGVTVGPNVYIGPHAAVLGGSVTGNAVIQDNATVWNGSVSGNAVIGALTQFNDNITISGSAKILAVKDVQGLLSTNGVFGGTVQVIGDVEEYISTAPSTGVFYGIINDTTDQQANYGAGVTTPPVEVTAPVVMGTNPQTIAFTAIPNQVAGTAAPLSATALSGLPVAFYTTTPTVCSVSGFSVNSLAAGTCTVQASQAGNGTYAAASTTSSFTVSAPSSPVAQTITFRPIPSQTVVGTSFTLYASATSGLPVSFTSNTPTYCSLPANGSTLTLLAAGTCTVQAAQAGNGSSFQAAPAATVSFTITAQQQQTINFPAFPFEVVINSPFSPVASATSGLPITYTSLSPNVCTVSGSNVNAIATGTCTVQAAQAGNAQYASASSVQQSFTITPLHPQTINFPAIPSQTVGATVTLSAQANSGLAVSYSATPASVCTLNSSAGTVAVIAGGTCVITATQTGTGFFAAATPVSQSFTVASSTPQAQTITFNTSSAQAVGSILTVSATASSGLAVTFSVIPNGNCSISGSTVTFLNTGNCGVVANQAGNASYQAAPAVGRIIVVNSPTSQSITFHAVSAQIIGASLTLSATATSGLTVTFTSSTPSVCTVSGTSVTLPTAGTCTIVASQPGNATYSAAPSVAQSFAVSASQLSQTITFNAIPAQTVGTPLTVNATASSGLPVTYTVVQNGNCSVSGNVVTFVNVGACGVIANQAGNSAYAAAPAVGQVITVNAAPLKSQTITFNPVAAQKHGTTLTMTATASSGLPITYVVVQNGNCSVSGAAVTFINPGACGVIATQPGNSTYAAAAAVGQVISVN